MPTLSWISGVSRYLQSVVEGSSYCCFFYFFKVLSFQSCPEMPVQSSYPQSCFVWIVLIS